MMTNTKQTAEDTYFALLASFRLVSAAHTAVTLRYRAREIGDAAFLVSRASLDHASRAVDAAEAAYNAAMQEPSAIERMIAHEVSIVEGRR